MDIAEFYYGKRLGDTIMWHDFGAFKHNFMFINWDPLPSLYVPDLICNSSILFPLNVDTKTSVLFNNRINSSPSFIEINIHFHQLVNLHKYHWLYRVLIYIFIFISPQRKQWDEFGKICGKIRVGERNPCIKLELDEIFCNNFCKDYSR